MLAVPWLPTGLLVFAETVKRPSMQTVHAGSLPVDFDAADDQLCCISSQMMFAWLKSPRRYPARQHGKNRPLVYRSALPTSTEGKINECTPPVPAVLSDE